MKVRLQADADLNEDIVAGVIRREPQIDFQTAAEANLRGLSDQDVLTLAGGEKTEFWLLTIDVQCLLTSRTSCSAITARASLSSPKNSMSVLPSKSWC